MTTRYRRFVSKCGVSLAGCAALALAGLLMGSAPAQSQPKKGSDAKTAVDTKATPGPKVGMPGAEGIVLLVRTTLLTLNDAVQTGNFTVLRDRAAPGFRDTNSAARLGVIFGNLARRGIDLAAVAILAPQLDEPPAIDARTSMLRIKGHFPGQPVRIDFDLIYQLVGGHWRAFGISVQPVSTGANAAAGAAPAATKVAPAKPSTPSSSKKTQPAKR